MNSYQPSALEVSQMKESHNYVHLTAGKPFKNISLAVVHSRAAGPPLALSKPTPASSAFRRLEESL